VSTSESQRLLDAITHAGDRYRVKYREGTQIMDCIFYWDPSDVQLARRFSQVIQVDTTFKDNTWRYPLLEITATTNEMNTILIAQALIPSESAENFLWVLQQVHPSNWLISSLTTAFSSSTTAQDTLRK
jgi:MULE transposase domain